jgi:hypothetical protein
VRVKVGVGVGARVAVRTIDRVDLRVGDLPNKLRHPAVLVPARPRVDQQRRVLRCQGARWVLSARARAQAVLANKRLLASRFVSTGPSDPRQAAAPMQPFLLGLEGGPQQAGEGGVRACQPARLAFCSIHFIPLKMVAMLFHVSALEAESWPPFAKLVSIADILCLSKTVTSKPRSASALAVVTPVMPAPMTAMLFTPALPLP